jgi:glycosyltransferase involved in cell wall biosynthesis
MNPLVSIIVPCYNAEAWVAETLASALAQTWAATEVIAVNDGSRDGTLAVLRRHEGGRLRVIDQPNRGASAARNAGLRAAQGELVQFLDADDLLAPDKVAQQVAALAAAPEGTVASGRWARFTADPAKAPVVPSVLFRDFAPVAYVLTHAQTGDMMHPAAWLVPAAVARAAGPWDESLSLNDDGEYFARVALASAGVIHVPGALSLYRSGLPLSLSGRKDARARQSLFASCILVAGHLRRAEDSPQVRAALADYLQRLAFELYPGDPALHRRAQAEAYRLGGSAVRPAMGARQALLARMVGWKLARRAARLLGR